MIKQHAAVMQLTANENKHEVQTALLTTVWYKIGFWLYYNVVIWHRMTHDIIKEMGHSEIIKATLRY